MAEYRFDQFNFNAGEIDPKTQGRTDWEEYYKAAKRVRNCIVIPQGGVQRRWGTQYVDTIDIATVPLGAELSTFVINDTTTYLMVWEALSLKIYLENILIATVVTTYAQEDVPNLRFAQVDNRLIVVNENFAPMQVTVVNGGANAITAIDGPNNGLTVTNALVVGTVYPASFTTAGTLPVTSPQIYVNRQYFVKPYTTLSVQIFSTSDDALAGINFYTIAAAAPPASNLVIQNTWAITAITFKFYPSFDFTGGYNAITFTPSAVTGNITMTASGAIFTAAFIGGVIIGNGGVMRITGFTDTTHVTGYTEEDFANTNAILGTETYLAQPAWSAAQGYPRTVSFFQNRLVFAGSTTIPNGVWLSVINDVFNFDDTQTAADDAISWYPASGGINYIRSITSGRSLVVHSNTGSYTTQLGTEVPITPTNFTLTEQNKLGVANIQPVFIDNQIIFADKSGNNIISMIFEITQNAFVTSNISVPSSSLIVNPTDMAAFAQPNATDGFYALFVNADGTLAFFQTLYEQNIAAWSLMSVTSNVYSGPNSNPTVYPAKFIRVITSGALCWFTVQRMIPAAQLTTAITGVDTVNNVFFAAGHGVSQNVGDLGLFDYVDAPVTVPALVPSQFYFVRGINANEFAVYLSQSDADTDANRLQLQTIGNTAYIIDFLVKPIIYIEELTFDAFSDSVSDFNFTNPTTALTGLEHLVGCVVAVTADGYVLPSVVPNIDGEATISQPGTIVQAGIGFTSTFSPLPLSIPQTYGLLYKPKHIRTIYFRYYQSIGMTIQTTGLPSTQLTGVPLIPMQDFVVGEPMLPMDGTFLFTPMEGFDAYDSFDIQITQALPLPMTILGLSYVVEI